MHKNESLHHLYNFVCIGELYTNGILNIYTLSSYLGTIIEYGIVQCTSFNIVGY